MILQLLRARQWYKNLVVFLPIVFAGSLLVEGYLQTVLFAFLSLCFVSSAGYIINDIVDAKEDKWHPEKSKRPIAAGKIELGSSLLISLILLVGSLSIATKLSQGFAICVLALFLTMQVYTFLLKRELFADTVAVSSNFVIRAVAGAVVIGVRVSPWLILCTFFLSMFMVSAKRKGDLGLVENRYTPEITDKLMIFSTVALVISYSLYSFLSLYPLLIITLPFAIYVIFSYSNMTDKDRVLARNPEKIFLEPKIMIGSLLWIATVFIVVYYKPFTWIF